MCGIFAAIAPRCAPACHFAPKAVELLKHRGPDASGTLLVELPTVTVTLGMSRLKVVDQTDIPVPFDFRRGLGIALAFNGEIYNWRELRAELNARSDCEPWETSCDAEVLAAAWRAWGVKCLDKLNGMFAFVLVDTVKDEVYAVRDRAGEKPLYWCHRDSRHYLYYASEPKALPIALRACSCPDMDVLEFDCGRHTPLANVYAVPPGEYQVLASTGVRTEHVWWELPLQAPPGLLVDPKQELFEELKATFEDAVRLRNVSERKVAIQLSGGLDSAMTQAVARCENPYCVSFGAKLDNLSMAEYAAAPFVPAGTAPPPRVIPVTFTKAELLAALPEVAYYLDTPATWTAVCQWFLNKRIAEDGGVVVLSGEGADELFGGYSRYRVLYWLDMMRADQHLAGYEPLIRRTFDGSPSRFLAQMLDRSGGESGARAEYLVEVHGGHGTFVDRMARTDFYTTMQVLVRMADRMSACFGLENRSPFFDYRLMELSARFPSTSKVTKDASKAILRRVARQIDVNPAIVHEQTKRGLTVPKSWGNGSDWSRDWFAKKMMDAWRERCLRPALCESCGSCEP